MCIYLSLSCVCFVVVSCDDDCVACGRRRRTLLDKASGSINYIVVGVVGRRRPCVENSAVDIDDCGCAVSNSRLTILLPAGREHMTDEAPACSRPARRAPLRALEHLLCSVGACSRLCARCRTSIYPRYASGRTGHSLLADLFSRSPSSLAEEDRAFRSELAEMLYLLFLVTGGAPPVLLDVLGIRSGDSRDVMRGDPVVLWVNVV